MGRVSQSGGIIGGILANSIVAINALLASLSNNRQVTGGTLALRLPALPIMASPAEPRVQHEQILVFPTNE
jgi:hypothetical protein